MRGLLLTGCDQAGDVGHVGEQVGVALVRNLPHARIVVVPASRPLPLSTADPGHLEDVAPRLLPF